MKHLKTLNQLNKASEKLNISDVRQRFNENVKDWYSIYSDLKKRYINLKNDVLQDVANRKEDFNNNWKGYIEYEQQEFVNDSVDLWLDSEFTEEEIRKVANQVIKDCTLDNL